MALLGVEKGHVTYHDLTLKMLTGEAELLRSPTGDHHVVRSQMKVPYSCPSSSCHIVLEWQEYGGQEYEDATAA